MAGKKCSRNLSASVWRLPSTSGWYAENELFLITVRRKWSDLWYVHSVFAVEIACNFAALGAVIDPSDQDDGAFVTPPSPAWRGTMRDDLSFTFSCLAALVGIRLWCVTQENITTDSFSCVSEAPVQGAFYGDCTSVLTVGIVRVHLFLRHFAQWLLFDVSINWNSTTRAQLHSPEVQQVSLMFENLPKVQQNKGLIKIITVYICF